MNQSSAIQPEDILDSWKDIAAYLKRDISTVQRWERREDMPVHRHVHDMRGSVYAFRSELAVWLESRRLRLEQEADQRTAETAESVVPAFHHRMPIGRRWLLAGAMTALVAAATYLLLADRVATTRAVSVRSLAVLPLQNLSADPAQEFFVDGITEALIGRLSRIPGIRVISRTSAMHFKGSRLPVPEIAQTLHVDAVIEGSVVRSGSRLRISAQLISGATDDHLWSGSYDRELRDVLSLQDEVTQAIARQIQITIGAQESVRRDAPRVSPDAYEDYLRGRFALNRSLTASPTIASGTSRRPSLRIQCSRLPTQALVPPTCVWARFSAALCLLMRGRTQSVRPRRPWSSILNLLKHTWCSEALRCDSGSGTLLKRATAERSI